MSNRTIHQQLEACLPGVISRDPEAEQAFFEAAYPLLHRWAAKQFHLEHSDLEDFVMEVLEKILVRLNRYQAGRACFNTWMFAVAKNYRRDQLRRMAKGQDPVENALPEDVLGWIERPAASDSPDQHDLPESPIRVAMRSAIADLPEADHRFLELTCLSGLSSGQVAHQLGLTAAAVRQRKSRIIAQLRTNLPSL